MHNIVLHFLLFLSFFFTPYVAFGKPIGGREKTSMDFATIIIDTTGDTITLTPSGSISAANASMFTGTASASEFSMSGDKNTAVSISFSSGDVLTGPGSNMPLGSFTHDAGPTPSLDNKGKLVFNVGANLTINASQADGAYSGTYMVTVDYD